MRLRMADRTSSGSRNPLMFATAFGTVDGGIGMFVPLAEKEFKRLYTLQTLMTHALPHNCGLNPKGFRYDVAGVWGVLGRGG